MSAEFTVLLKAFLELNCIQIGIEGMLYYVQGKLLYIEGANLLGRPLPGIIMKKKVVFSKFNHGQIPDFDAKTCLR